MNTLSIVVIILASVLSGVMYRMGGSGNYPRQVRTVGIPILSALCSLFFVPWCWWAYILAFGLCIGAISTYWDFLFGDVDNFWLHGLMIGLAYLPLAIASGCWMGFIVRSVVLCVFMGIWSLAWDWDIAEEFGRGASIVASLPLLLIG